jgi:prevent-host-death family protein
MKVVNVHAAKSNLSKLIEEACKGEEVVIARGSEPVVKLVPVHRAEVKRQFGSLKGRLVVPDDFMEPLTSEEVEAWHQ